MIWTNSENNQNVSRNKRNKKTKTINFFLKLRIKTDLAPIISQIKTSHELTYD